MKPEHHHHHHYHHQNEKRNVNNNINKGQKITNSTFSTKVKSYFPSEEREREREREREIWVFAKRQNKQMLEKPREANKYHTNKKEAQVYANAAIAVAVRCNAERKGESCCCFFFFFFFFCFCCSERRAEAVGLQTRSRLSKDLVHTG